MKRIGCCKDCMARHPACHDSCKKYKQEREEMEAEKRMILKEKNKYFQYICFQKAKARKYRR